MNPATGLAWDIPHAAVPTVTPLNPGSDLSRGAVWFCAMCCEEWDEPFCSYCGQKLTREISGGPEVPAQDKAQGRTNEEVT